MSTDDVNNTNQSQNIEDNLNILNQEDGHLNAADVSESGVIENPNSSAHNVSVHVVSVKIVFIKFYCIVCYIINSNHFLLTLAIGF